MDKSVKTAAIIGGSLLTGGLIYVGFTQLSNMGLSSLKSGTTTTTENPLFPLRALSSYDENLRPKAKGIISVIQNIANAKMKKSKTYLNDWHQRYSAQRWSWLHFAKGKAAAAATKDVDDGLLCRTDGNIDERTKTVFSTIFGTPMIDEVLAKKILGVSHF